MDATPRRRLRWYQYSLRSLMLVVLLVAALCSLGVCTDWRLAISLGATVMAYAIIRRIMSGTRSGVFRGTLVGLLIGWATGITYWTSLVVVFGLEPALVTVIEASTGRHETWVNVFTRLALVPARAIPLAVIAGAVGAAVASNRARPATEGQPTVGRRVVTGTVFGLLLGWIVGAILWTCLAIGFGPTGDTYEHGGVIRVENRYPVLETLALGRWMAVPWAVAGAIVGAVIGWIGGWLEAITSALGMIVALCVVLSVFPFDGWLVLIMPIYGFAGLGVGLAGGFLIRFMRRLARCLIAKG